MLVVIFVVLIRKKKSKWPFDKAEKEKREEKVKKKTIMYTWIEVV